MKKLCILAIILLSSCVSQQLNRFSGFADAGSSYCEAMHKLTREAGLIAIDADSELLLEDRDLFSQDERREIYKERTQALEELLATLSSIRDHTSLLERYFTSLSQLSGTKSQSALNGQLESVISSLRSIHPGLENASIGNASVKDFMGAASPMMISVFKQKKLGEELRKNGATIERELELQQALLTALTEQMKSDLELMLKMKDFQTVSQPFINAARMPDNWKEKRKEILTTYLMLDAADKARSAAGELKNAWLNLLGSSDGIPDFRLLFDDIGAMIDLVEMVRNNQEK